MSFEDEFLGKLREALSHQFGGVTIVDVLKDAKCSFDVKSYENSDDLYTILYIEVPIQELFGFVPFDSYHEDILYCAQKIFPKNRPPLDFIKSSALFTHSAKPSTNKNIEHNHSIFGEPSTDPQFQCDIFVIMPFHDDFRWLYENVIEQSIKNINASGQKLVVKRADNASKPSAEIMKKVWSMMNYCSLVIAICTPKDGDKDKFNPNVFYEVGIAHTIGKEVILVTDKSSELPFDIRHLEAVEYIDDKPANVDKLKRTLSEIITQHFKKT